MDIKSQNHTALTQSLDPVKISPPNHDSPKKPSNTAEARQAQPQENLPKVKPRPNLQETGASQLTAEQKKLGFQSSKEIKATKIALDYNRAAYEPDGSSKRNIPPSLSTRSDLQNNFKQLSTEDADKILSLAKETDVRLYKDERLGGLVFAARGTKDLDDVKQDIDIAEGETGHKVDKLKELTAVMDKNNIRPDFFTGHSLGGLMAMSASEYFQQQNTNGKNGQNKDRNVIVFDSAPINRQTKKEFSVKGVADDTVNIRIKSPFSLGAVTKLNPGYVKVPTIKLPESENSPDIKSHLLANIEQSLSDVTGIPTESS